MVSVTNADTYFQEEVFDNADWLNATEEDKRRALKNAENQLYRFYPRFKPDIKPIPEKAIYEQAIFLLRIDETVRNASQLGVRQVSLSGLSISVDAPKYPISPEVKLIVSQAGGGRVGRYKL